MVRSMEQRDIPQVLSLMSMLRVESTVFSHYPEDPAYVTNQLTFMVQSPMHIMLIDVDNHERLKGVMFGFTGSPWWSPYYEANEMLLAVSEEYRGSSVAVRLIKEFECIAVNRRCMSINVGSSLGINDDRVERLYKHLGYESRGHGLTKRTIHYV